MPNVWGGARKGAGRLAGVSGTTREQRALEMLENYHTTMAGIPPEIASLTPLEVMVRAMAISVTEGDWKSAVVYAAAAAPYLHPRLATVEVKANGARRVEEYTDEELIAIASAASSEGGIIQEVEGETEPS